MKSIVKILIIGVSIITPLAGFAQEKRDTISGFNADGVSSYSVPSIIT